MSKQIYISFLSCSLLVISSMTFADPVTVKKSDTVQNILEMQMGKRVSVKIKSGEELTGTVQTVTKELTHLGALSGKEFYDAVIVNQNIAAVIIRTK